MLLFLGWQTVLSFLVGPAFEVLASSGTSAGLQLLGPAEAVMAALKLSTIGAIVLGAPWILLQFWLFIAPGLYARERRFIHLVIPLSALLTITGTVFLHRIMLPLLFELMLGFGSSLTVDLPDHHADLRALFVASETVEVRTAPPRTLVEGQAWVEALRWKLGWPKPMKRAKCKLSESHPSRLGSCKTVGRCRRPWISRSCCWVAFPSPSNCLC